MVKSDVYTRTCTQLTFDLNSGTLGHFQTWRPPLSLLKHIKIHFEHGCQNVLKNANRIFFQALDGQLYMMSFLNVINNDVSVEQTSICK